MNLIVFPLKHENPFPVQVKTGEPLLIDSNTMILCSGVGTAGVNNLGRVLFENPEIKSVFEFGSAATISKGRIGSIYECSTFCSFDGSILGTTGKYTKLPDAAVTGNDELYTGEEYEWAQLFEIPVLYTMETLMFRAVALEFRKQFLSIRLVTDDGSGNIREQVAKEINLAKKNIRNLFISLEKVK